MFILQISLVREHTIVAVLGQRGKKAKTSGELWFSCVVKDSHESDGFIEGRWLYEVENKGKSPNKQFELRMSDVPDKIPKASILEDVVDVIVGDGIYTILMSTLERLEALVSFENDTFVDSGMNRPILDGFDNSKGPMYDASQVTLMQKALLRAGEWRKKVCIYHTSRHD